MTAELSFSQGLRFSDQDAEVGQTNLGFTLQSATRTQTFAVNIASLIEQQFQDGFQAKLVDPTASLSYGIESRQSAIETRYRFRQSDIDTIFETFDGFQDQIFFDEGTRQDQSATLSVAFGREAPFGGNVGLGFRQTDYSDTEDPDLFDTTQINASLNLSFAFDRRITGTVGYQISDTDRDGGTDVRNQYIRAGLDLAVTPTRDVSLSIGNRRFDDDGQIDNGLTFGLDITQDQSDGAFSFSLDTDLTEAGRRSSINVGRRLETRNGAFSASVGATKSDTSAIQPLVELRYEEDLRNGALQVVLNQSFSTTSQGLDALNSQLRVDWLRELTRSSNLRTDISFQMTDILGADEDTARLDLGVSYTQALTSDWGITARYVHSRRTADARRNRQENDLFIGLETTWAWRP